MRCGAKDANLALSISAGLTFLAIISTVPAGPQHEHPLKSPTVPWKDSHHPHFGPKNMVSSQASEAPGTP